MNINRQLIPKDYLIISYGNLQKGDLIFMPKVKRFTEDYPSEELGKPINNFYCVVRRTKNENR